MFAQCSTICALPTASLTTFIRSTRAAGNSVTFLKLPGRGRCCGLSWDDDVRNRVFSILSELGATAVPGLIQGLAHAESRVRTGAAATLAGIGAAARSALPALRDVQQGDRDGEVREMAAHAIAKIESP